VVLQARLHSAEVLTAVGKDDCDSLSAASLTTHETLVMAKALSAQRCGVPDTETLGYLRDQSALLDTITTSATAQGRPLSDDERAGVNDVLAGMKRAAATLAKPAPSVGAPPPWGGTVVMVLRAN